MSGVAAASATAAAAAAGGKGRRWGRRRAVLFRLADHEVQLKLERVVLLEGAIGGELKWAVFPGGAVGSAKRRRR